ALDALSLPAVDQAIQLAGGTLRRSLPIISSRAATIPNVSLAAVAGNAAVQHIAVDRLILGADYRTNATIGADIARQSLGVDGSGVGVVVIDSGIAWHDDLAASAGGQRIDAFVDFVNNAAVPYDDYGHGTHVAGLIAGNGADSSAFRTGVAPGARL